MKDIINAVDQWTEQGKAIAIATVTETWGSSPRGVGAQMVVSVDGEMVGSVSGGCVEGAVVDTCMEVMRTGKSKYLHFGVADETAWKIGLSCGGKINVFVRLLDMQIFYALRTAWEQNRKFVIVTVIRDPEVSIAHEVLMLDNGDTIGGNGYAFNDQILAIAANTLNTGQSHLLTTNNGVALFFNFVAPPPTLIIVGGVHIAITLVSFANEIGFKTIVVDPRKAFANQTRFNHADRLYNNWPTEAFAQIKINESTAIAVLTHDPKIDDPALEIALSSPAYYIGALGSHKTQDDRRQRLLNIGLNEEQVGRLHAPIGLDLGGRTPEQISLAIMAEIVQVRNK